MDGEECVVVQVDDVDDVVVSKQIERPLLDLPVRRARDDGVK